MKSVFVTSLRSDKRKHPEETAYRLLTNEECRTLSGHALALDRSGKVVSVKITSIKTWKTRETVRVSWKFGLHEYGFEDLEPANPNRFFVTEATGPELSAAIDAGIAEVNKDLDALEEKLDRAIETIQHTTLTIRTDEPMVEVPFDPETGKSEPLEPAPDEAPAPIFPESWTPDYLRGLELGYTGRKPEDTQKTAPDEAPEYPEIWTPDGMQYTFTAPGEPIQPSLF